MNFPFERALLIACLLASCADEPPSRPNVLLYVSDTLRADGLACYGNTVVDTPNIDRMARTSLLFESAYAPSPWTRASMGSILSGTYPAVHGAEGRYDLLEDSVVLISELLRDHGYRTANVTTNRNVGAFFGFDQGYDNDGFIELYEPSTDNMVYVRELSTRADTVTDEAIAWLEAGTGPFCLIVHTIDPHSPYTPLPEWDRYGAGIVSDAKGTHDWLFEIGKNPKSADIQRIRSLYLGEIAFNDRAFGTLVAWLKESGKYDKTITIFTSDHGEEFWEYGERGHGKTVNEKSLHVPLILRYPNSVKPGRRSGLVSTVDILPTVLALLNIPTPKWIDGLSLLDDTSTDEPTIYSSCFLGTKELWTARTDRWKLVWNLKRDTLALHDMKSRQGEAREVSSKHADVTESLNLDLRKFVEQNRAKRLNLHGSPSAHRVDELPPEVEADLSRMGYAGD